MPTPLIRSSIVLVAVLAAACSGNRGPADRTPAAVEVPAPAADTAAPPAAESSPHPPDCTSLGESISPPDNGLDATFEVFRCAPGQGLNDVVFNVRLTNRSDAPLKLDTRALHFPMLVFEVRDAQGNPVHGGPPPVPPEDDPTRYRVTLGPNDDYIFDATLAGVIAVDLAPGGYDLRFVHEAAPSADGSWAGRVETPWVRITLPVAAH